MNIRSIFSPWKRAAQLERENQRLRDLLDHEERRNFDYMFRRMEQEQHRYAQLIAQNEVLLKTNVDIANLMPREFVMPSDFNARLKQDQE
jgi:hypothetical protein